MSGCDFDTLESLAFEELSSALADEARAHVATCPACARELGLLRAERGVFADRARASTPLPDFSAALARSRRSRPAVVSVKASPSAASPRRHWAIPAFGVAAAAFAGIFLLPPNGPARIEPPAEVPIVAEPASEDFCHDEAFYSRLTSSPKSPDVCEMPERTFAPATIQYCAFAAEADSPAGPAGIDTCEPDSYVTEARCPPLPD